MYNFTSVDGFEREPEVIHVAYFEATQMVQPSAQSEVKTAEDADSAVCASRPGKAEDTSEDLHSYAQMLSASVPMCCRQRSGRSTDRYPSGKGCEKGQALAATLAGYTLSSLLP